MYNNFINELYGDMAITWQSLEAYRPLVAQILQGNAIADQKKEPLKLGLFDSLLNQIATQNTEEEPIDSVAVIKVNGILTKFGSWWDYGAEDYAALLYRAYADESIKAVVIDMHSGGGGVHSVFPFEEAIAARNKPVIGIVNSMAKSAAYYVLTLTDKVFAINKMAEVGSIGVMAQLMNDDKMMEAYGIKIITIIPPESKWKNRAYFEAKNGKPELLIKEELSPWAIHFQDVVKTNRPDLDLSIPGIIEGREFYASDALNYGLIDDIKPYSEIIQEAFEYNNNQFNNLINQNPKQ